MLKNLDIELPNIKYDSMNTTRVYDTCPELFKPIPTTYNELDTKEKFLADLFTSIRIFRFYVEFSNKTFCFELNVDNPTKSILIITEEYKNYASYTKFNFSSKCSTHTYYIYHKLSQFRYSNYHAFCRVEEFKLIGQIKPLVIYFPLEFSNLNLLYFPIICPEIIFNNELDRRQCEISNGNQDIYYPGELYIQLSSSITSDDLQSFEEKRFNKKIYRNDYEMMNKGLYLLQLFETYLPYLLLSFVQHNLIDDIKFQILDKLNFSKHDNVLRILKYDDHNDIRRILPYLIENMENGKGYIYK